MATKNNEAITDADSLASSRLPPQKTNNHHNGFDRAVTRKIAKTSQRGQMKSKQPQRAAATTATAAVEEREGIADMDHQRQNNANQTSWMVPIVQMLGCIEHQEVRASSISKVPDKLRKPNKGAYAPQVVSVGPLHKGTGNDLLLMEHHKWSYMKSLLEQTSIPEEPNQETREKEEENDNTEETTTQQLVLYKCGSTVLGLDNIVRASYGGNIEAEPHELAKTMLVDGCFVLEFLLRLQNYRETLREENEGDSISGGDDDEEDPYINGGDDNIKEDPIFESQKKLLPVLSDLTLLENQVPFIVLKKLYRKLFPDKEISLEEDHRVAKLALEALGYPFFVLPTSGVAHLLHLVHMYTGNLEGQHEMTQALKELKRCATRLRAAGITIMAANSSNRGKTNDKHSNLVDSFDFAIEFNNGELEIPPLHIKETTEVKWRNLIAWEQSLTGKPWKLTSYALFFQGLICCGHDIELLEKNGVIVNDCKKSKEDLLKLFRKICEGVEHMDTRYSELCVELNKYKGGKQWKKFPIVTWHQCRRIFAIIVFYWKNWYQILIEQHIPTVWKLIGVLAAIALLVLTIMQTYYAAHSSH